MTLVRTHTHWSAWVALAGCLGAMAAPVTAAEMKGGLDVETDLFQPAKKSSPVVHTTQPVRPFVRPLFADPVKHTITPLLQDPWKGTQESSTDPSRVPDDLFGDPFDEFTFGDGGFDDVLPLQPERHGAIVPGASSPVPAPGSLVLFGLGAAAGCRRRRR